MRIRRLSFLFHLHILLPLLHIAKGETEEHGDTWREELKWRGRKYSPHIIGGTDADPGEFPHQVSVQHKGFLSSRHVCGATIITNVFVLTAASCIDRYTTKSLAVVAGVTSLDDDSKQVVGVGAVIIHEDYISETHSNNIALLKLSEPLVLGSLVQPLALPPEGEVVDGDTLCTAIGWGATIESGDFYKHLQKTRMTTISDEKCRTSYGAIAIEDSMLCAGLAIEDTDTCDGDEGGPLLCNGQLHGVTSWGKGCLQPYYPRVFSEVSYYRNWIIMYISGL